MPAWTRVSFLTLALVGPAVAGAQAGVPSISLDGVTYIHRWSQAGQHEFTPADQEDLESWTDMVTVNLHPAATGDDLATLANGVLTNYERAGRIVRTDSRARTASAPAEHFIAAVLGSPTFLEAAFARVVLVEGAGVVVVRSHRIYGESAGDAMSAWLAANGQRIQDALMSWRGVAQTVRALRAR